MAGSNVVAVSPRRWSDVLLFSVTAVELGVLLLLTPALALPDWIYVLQHVMVLMIALTRRAPAVVDGSFGVAAAVVVSYAYPYAQVIYLQRMPGWPLWPQGGMVLIVFGALLVAAAFLVFGDLVVGKYDAEKQHERIQQPAGPPTQESGPGACG